MSRQSSGKIEDFLSIFLGDERIKEVTSILTGHGKPRVLASSQTPPATSTGLFGVARWGVLETHILTTFEVTEVSIGGGFHQITQISAEGTAIFEPEELLWEIHGHTSRLLQVSESSFQRRVTFLQTAVSKQRGVPNFHQLRTVVFLTTPTGERVLSINEDEIFCTP